MPRIHIVNELPHGWLGMYDRDTCSISLLRRSWWRMWIVSFPHELGHWLAHKLGWGWLDKWLDRNVIKMAEHNDRILKELKSKQKPPRFH
jgi:hypothetical protein